MLKHSKNRCDWFVVAKTLDGQSRICTKKDVEEILCEDILAGRLRADGAVRVYSKRAGSWDESTPSLRDFAQQHSKLQAVYEPVWAFARNGLACGMLAGIGFATLNAIVLYAMTDRRVAISLSVAVLAHFIPGVVRKIAPYLIALSLIMGGAGSAYPTLAGVILFAVLGAVSGMAIGGAIGWAWEEKLPRAPDAPAAAHGAIQSVVLPLVGSLLLWSAYIFVIYPWAVRVSGTPLTAWSTPAQP